MSKTRLKLADNAYQNSCENGDCIVTFHNTEIIIFKANGNIILNSGGYRTPTTKERINRFLPGYHIEQRNNIWYISDDQDNETIFLDGMIITNNKLPENKKIEKDTKKLVEKINKFVSLIDTMKEIPYPDKSGDCWDCNLRTKSGKIIGELSKSDHLLLHIKEKYLHGSLIWNAMVWAGYPNPEIHFQLGTKHTIKSALRRYLKSKLLPR